MLADPRTPEGCRAGLDTLLAAVQKARSNLLEAAGANTGLLEQTNPMLFGAHTIADILVSAATMPPDDTFELQLLYLNVLALAEHEPAIGVAALNAGSHTLPSLTDAQGLVYPR